MPKASDEALGRETKNHKQIFIRNPDNILKSLENFLKKSRKFIVYLFSDFAMPKALDETFRK